jgi:hypothetical protein
LERSNLLQAGVTESVVPESFDDKQSACMALLTLIISIPALVGM